MGVRGGQPGTRLVATRLDAGGHFLFLDGKHFLFPFEAPLPGRHLVDTGRLGVRFDVFFLVEGVFLGRVGARGQ